MDHGAGSKVLVSLLLALSVAGCAQQQTTQNLASPIEQEQALWEKLTAEADRAASKGNYSEAEAKYRLAMLEAQKLGESNPQIAGTVSNLADFYYAQGDGEQADELYSKAIALREESLGMEHVDLAKDLIGLGKVSAKQGDYAEAAEHFARAKKILEKANLPIPEELTAGLAEATGKQAPTTKAAGPGKG